MLQMNRAQIAEFAGRSDVAILPISQVTQHGPHLPISTDVLQTEELARRTIARLRTADLEVLLAPTIQVGHSPSHFAHPGTIALEPETLALVVRDVGRSLVSQGFRRLILLSCGGGNWPSVGTAAYHLRHHDDAEVWVLGVLETMGPAAEPFLSSTASGEPDGHAGELETSNVLAIAPELVDIAAIADVKSEVHKELMALPFRGFNFNELSRAAGIWNDRQISPVGMSGRPTQATAEKGNRILDAAADVLARHITRYVFREPIGPA